MRGAGWRIELMRFALLVVLTVALLSVAFRISSHDASTRAGRPSRPAVVPSTQPSATPTSPLPTTASGAPASSAPSASVKGQAVRRRPTSAQPVGANGQPILPVTGWDSAMKLGALAFLLIGGGTLAVRVGSPRRQPAPTVQD